MNEFKTVSFEQIDSVFKRIGKDWMLISAADGTRENTMTASWGCMGVLWNKPVAVCFIRPERHTYSLVENTDRLTLSFFDGGYRDALTLCGRTSGRDEDKFARAGLQKVRTSDGFLYPAEANLVLLCRKLYADDLKQASFIDPALLSNYENGGYHRMYICEIEEVLCKI